MVIATFKEAWPFLCGLGGAKCLGDWRGNWKPQGKKGGGIPGPSPSSRSGSQPEASIKVPGVRPDRGTSAAVMLTSPPPVSNGKGRVSTERFAQPWQGFNITLFLKEKTSSDLKSFPCANLFPYCSCSCSCLFNQVGKSVSKKCWERS